MTRESGEQDTQYLSFVLDRELYAVETRKVREVLEFTGATRVPRMPEYVRGVINLRGSVVPVVDLKQRFGTGRTESTPSTCVIIAEVCVDGERLVLGALADAVQEVVDLSSAQIEPPPRLGCRIDTGFLCGMGRRNDDFLMLLDIDRVFSTRTPAGGFS